MSKRRPMTRKEAYIRQYAAAAGIRLPEIKTKARCAASVFYRIVRGDATSARIDGVIATAIRRPVDELRNWS